MSLSPTDPSEHMSPDPAPGVMTDVRAVSLAVTHADPEGHRHRTLARNIALVLSSQVGIWIAGAGLAMVLPRYVSADAIGRLTFAVSFTNIFTLIVLFGSERYITREVARSPHEAAHLAFNALLTRLPLYVLSALLMAAFLIAFRYPSSTVQIVAIFTVSMFITGLGNTFIAVFQGLERMGPAAFASIIERIISGAIGLIVIVLVGMGMVAYAGVLVGANAFSVLIIGFVFMRSVGLSGKVDVVLCRHLLKAGAPFLVWGLALFVYGSVDIIILSVMTNDAVVGWYGTAYRFVGIAGFFPFALTTALLPNIASMNHERSIPLARRSFDIVAFISIPIAIFFAVGAQSLIDFLGYPPEYDNAAILLRILAIHIPLVGFTMVGGTLLIAANREGPRTKAAITAAVLSPTLNLLAIPYFQAQYDNGAVGAAIVTCVVEAFIVVVVYALLDKRMFTSANVRIAMRCGVAGGVMAGAMYLVLPYGLLAIMAVGSVSYFAAALALRAFSLRELLGLPGIVFGSKGPQVVPVDDGLEFSPGCP